MYTIDLQQKVAIVTGAHQGIGLQIAIALLDAGCKCVLVDLNEEIQTTANRLAEQFPNQVYAVQGDIRTKKSCEEIFVKTMDKFARVDILVNNAGIMRTTPFLEVSEEEWDLVMTINLKGMFFLTQIVATYMKDNQIEGSIINMSSIAGRSGRPLAPHYAASKAAVISLTKSSAEAFGKFNIRTNALCPGVISTPMMDEIFEKRKIIEKQDPRDTFLQRIKLDRLGTPEDIAKAALFLSSDLSSYINGQAINVCGGYEMN
ncbi:MULTISPECIES: SDR family NAD(P)-dependent oxidoreductase [Metasolibacillus]|uniref:SDR family NAD(P)-dependent oxidoreductase n=1 Tax=Metasolibacillus TaxID=2703677 RepID=UPI000799C2CB|nr:SDR family NAD(P)-dependent oxidoreductase [Metasolibacillus fluoroglycofenilyticus]KYG89300.1 hypothetical protein A0U40_10905 [[Bacillus] sp. KCTC 13219]